MCFAQRPSDFPVSDSGGDGTASPAASPAKVKGSLASVRLVVVLGCAAVFLLCRSFLAPISLVDLSQFPAWQIPGRLCVPVSCLLIASVVWNLWNQYSLRAKASTPAYRSQINKFTASSGVWVALLILTLVTCRWETLAVPRHNLDEAESVSAARVLAQDGRFWFSVDVGTHGPVISLGQRILPLLGLKVDFPSSHLLAVLIWAGVTLAAYSILRRAAPVPVARLLTLPLVFISGSLRGEEFACYNGEHALVFLTMVSLACLIGAFLPPLTAYLSSAPPYVPQKKSLWLLWVSGFLGGSLCWAKIQGLPLALALFLLYAVGNGIIPPPPGLQVSRVRLLRSLCFLGGFVFPSLLLLIHVEASGTLTLMVRSYFQWNLAYASRFSSVGTPQFYLHVIVWAFHNFVVMTRFQMLFLISFAISIGIWSFRRVYRGLAREQIMLLICLVFLTAASWFCAIKPGNRYQHYMLIPLVPTFLINAVLWSHLIALHASSPFTKRLGRHPALYWLLLAVVTPWIFWTTVVIPRSGPAHYLLPNESITHPVSADVVRQVVSVTRPDDRITVWGWAPDLYVFSNRLPATRTTACLREAVVGFPMQPYFYQTFLRDFDRNRPVVFVDEMRVPVEGGNFSKSALTVVYENIVLNDKRLPNWSESQFTHEHYPELATRIQRGYTLFYTSPEGIRLWIRNDCRTRIGTGATS